VLTIHFFGSQAGNSATNAYSSNFLGQNAETQQLQITQISLVKMLVIVQLQIIQISLVEKLVICNKCYQLKFHGQNAGRNAINASNANFIGSSAGNITTNAYQSNFMGNLAGNQAINAYNSNFFGYNWYKRIRC
jgi:hypothetical protein